MIDQAEPEPDTDQDTEPGTEPEYVSIGQAAARLGTDESTLRRFLKRPKNATHFTSQTRTQTRATRTGTRTATLYPFPLVEKVWTAPRSEADDEEADPASQTQTRTGTQTQTADNADTDTGPGEVIPAALARAVMRATVAEARAELLKDALKRERRAHRHDKAEAAAALKREQDNLAEAVRTIRQLEQREATRLGAAFQAGATARELLPAVSSEGQNVSPERVSAPETNAAVGAQVDGEKPQDATAGAAGDPRIISREIIRPWWKFWGSR